jgi:hypothetical protein
MRELQADSNQVGKPLAPDGLKTSGGVAKVLNPRALRRLRRRFVNKVAISDVFEQSQHGSIFRPLQRVNFCAGGRRLAFPCASKRFSPFYRNQLLAAPTVSAILAPRSPKGSSRPVVVSRAV